MKYFCLISSVYCGGVWGCGGWDDEWSTGWVEEGSGYDEGECGFDWTWDWDWDYRTWEGSSSGRGYYYDIGWDSKLILLSDYI